VKRGHRQLDHTADLALELWAPTEAELLEEGAQALIALLTEDAQVGAKVERALHIDAVDPTDRLVRWLNEVLYLAISEGFLVAEADLVLHETGLDARVRGQDDGSASLRAEIKSVTYHDLVLTRRDDGSWSARVVMDV